MTEQQIRFDDGASYERSTGVWSKLAGNVFLDWLKPQSGLRWVDVGCGNGAFTELIFNRRSVRGTARFCSYASRGSNRKISVGRCDGTPLLR
jgi:hypothetical protein